MKLSYDAGEPCALKGASTVRGRPVRNVLKSNALAGYPTSRAEAKPGDPGLTSLLNLVEMKSDSSGGHNQRIRTTCLRAEHFSERNP